MNDEKQSPITPLLQSLLKDRDYLHSWHANLAMSTYDALDRNGFPHERRWRIGQEAARRFISTLFSGEPETPELISDDEARTGVAHSL